jgi:hypothetical protein
VRSLPAALASYLQGNDYLCADLFEFDVGGTTYRLTNSDRDLVGVAPASGTYTAANIDRERIRSSDGLQVDDLELVVATGEELLGKSWFRLVMDGDLDEAPVRVYRAYLNKVSLGVVGCYLRFSGVVLKLEPGSTTTRLVVAVSANEFGRPFPAVSYESECVWNFAGPGCDYSGAVEFTATVGAESTATILQIDAMPGGAPAIYKFWKGTVTSGDFTRTTTSAEAAGGGSDVGADITTGYGFRVSPAFPAPLVAGSTVTIRAGCGKTAALCNDWWSNLVNFMGAPVAPAKP